MNFVHVAQAKNINSVAGNKLAKPYNKGLASFLALTIFR